MYWYLLISIWYLLHHLLKCIWYQMYLMIWYLLKCTNKVLDIIGVRETWLMKTTFLTSNINLHKLSFWIHNYWIYCWGGAILHIANHLSYKTHNDLNLYKANQLEFIFIEINDSKNNIIVGCLYGCYWLKEKHKPLLDKQSKKKNKPAFLLGDFNINSLNYHDHQPNNKCLDFLRSNSFIPHSLSKTLIDNIFSSMLSQEVISGNNNFLLLYLIICHNFHLFIMYFQTHLAQSQIFTGFEIRTSSHTKQTLAI